MSKNNITTSEGEAYILFISLVQNDKDTFDLVYKWTNSHLRREDGF